MRTTVLFLVLLVSGAALAEPPDAETLQREVDRAWHADVEAWADYAFRRLVTRQSFDADGEETFRQDLEYRVTPTDDGFDELLVGIDGREPTKGEIKEYRKKAIFTKHYKQAADLNLANPLGEDLALLPIIQAQDHRLVGEDEVGGIPCYRTEFDARPEPDGGSVREKLKYAIEGSACFATDGFHVVAFEMRTARGLKSKGIKLNSLQMTIEGQAVGDGWAPKLVRLRSDVVVFGKKMRKGNTWHYDEFRHQPSR